MIITAMSNNLKLLNTFTHTTQQQWQHMKMTIIPFLILFHTTPTFSLLLLPLHQIQTPPPLPLQPIPTAQQLSWQQSEMSLFLHFGPNTFTNSEWGDGKTDPSVFNPPEFDAHQWVSVADSYGFSRLILTVKHHDGFCLWPSEYTDYSVKSCQWRNGSGDVLGDLVLAAQLVGVDLGVYLSPWDRHESSYGKSLEYNQFYLGQMNELLTRYGKVKEVWLDGAKGEGEKNMDYYFDIWFNVIHQLQPEAVIFSDAGPDVRWVGDEDGIAGPTCWSSFNKSAARIGDTDPLYSREGDQFGVDWVPAECDVSIRPGWFWHPSETPKSALTLLDIYYKSVGRNCLLLLNVPPNSSGLISDEDTQVLKEFSNLRNSIFALNLAKNATVSATSKRGGNSESRFDPLHVTEEGIYTYWAPSENKNDWILCLDLKERRAFNVLQVQEPIQMGQRIISFHFDVLNDDGVWNEIVKGTTVGYKRLLRFPTVEVQYLRLVIDQARADPLVSFVGVYMDPFSVMASSDMNRRSPSRGVEFFSKLKDSVLYSSRLGKMYVESK